MGIIIQAAGILIVLLVLNKFVFGKVGGILAARQDEIVSRMNKLESDQAEVDQLTSETQQRLNEIGVEAEIQRDKDSAILELREQIAEIAINVASQVIDQQLDQATHQHIIDEYVSRLPEAPNVYRHV